MSEADFTAFLKTVLLVENTVDGLIDQICMDWRHMGEMLGAGCQVYTFPPRQQFDLFRLRLRLTRSDRMLEHNLLGF
ncbi:MAG: hypothetical protein WCB55_17600 [Pseudolabrys sp.]